MKKFLMFLCAVMLVFGMVGTASATLIDFNVADAPDSSVTLSNVSTFGWVSISADLVSGLGSEIFSLNDGESETFDFFNITIGGCWGVGTADITATLAFDTPVGSEITGSGSGSFGTFFGIISGGYLNWVDMPQIYTLSNGNFFDVDFEDILELGLGNSTTISATVTAHAAPVPEPATILLIGIGLLSMVGYSRKRLSKKG